MMKIKTSLEGIRQWVWAIPLVGLEWRQKRVANRINEILEHGIDTVTRELLDEAFVAYCDRRFHDAIRSMRRALRDHLTVCCGVDDVQLGTSATAASQETEEAIDADEQARRIDALLGIVDAHAEDYYTGRTT